MFCWSGSGVVFFISFHFFLLFLFVPVLFVCVGVFCRFSFLAVLVGLLLFCVFVSVLCVLILWLVFVFVCYVCVCLLFVCVCFFLSVMKSRFSLQF